MSVLHSTFLQAEWVCFPSVTQSLPYAATALSDTKKEGKEGEMAESSAVLADRPQLVDKEGAQSEIWQNFP